MKIQRRGNSLDNLLGKLNPNIEIRNQIVFGVLYFVFGMKYVVPYRLVRMLNTKHQIQNTFVKSSLFLLFTKSPRLYND
jgi:hypothetical protein